VLIYVQRGGRHPWERKDGWSTEEKEMERLLGGGYLLWGKTRLHLKGVGSPGRKTRMKLLIIPAHPNRPAEKRGGVALTSETNKETEQSLSHGEQKKKRVLDSVPEKGRKEGRRFVQSQKEQSACGLRRRDSDRGSFLMAERREKRLSPKKKGGAR